MTPDQPPVPLTKEEEAVVLLLATIPRATSGVLETQLGVSQSTVSRRITPLEERGIVRREGAGKNTVYVLADPKAFYYIPKSRRAPAAYDLAWIDAYQPNKTRLLTEQDVSRLEAAGQLPPGVQPSLFFQRIYERFMVDLSYASSKMEGNAYTLLDTENLLKLGMLAEGKDARDATMILNHKAAVDFVLGGEAREGITRRLITSLHAILARDILQPEQMGAVRNFKVEIGNSQYMPLEIPQQIAEQLELVATKAAAIESAFEQSIFLLTTIAYLQPFIDMNKRTGRLAANVPLVRCNLCPLSYRHMDADRYLAGLLLFYETRNIVGVKSAYIEGYEQSAKALELAFNEPLRAPTGVDFRYRRGIDMVVRAVVHDKERTEEAIIAEKTTSIPEADRVEVTQAIREKIAGLSPDSAAAFDLYPEEVEEFRKRRPGR